MKTIKHLVRDIFILLVSVTGKLKKYQTKQKENGPLVRVLCFHDVVDKVWFESVINLLVSDYYLLTPEDFHNKNFSPEKINILITFDDGYQSWVDNALPALEENNLKALFFINSGLLNIAEGKEDVSAYMKESLRITPKRAIDWRGAKKILEDGHTIGGHTTHHADLAQLTPEKLVEEIKKDKEVIEENLNTRIVDFAYPFGTEKHFNNKVCAEVSSAGYTYVYTAVTGFSSENNLEIPRTLVEKKQNLKSLKLWIEGGYDIFTISKL